MARRVRKFSSIVVLLAAGMVGNAATALEGVFIGPSLSAFLMDSDRFVDDDSDTGVYGGINLGYRFFNDWSLELNASTSLGGHEMEIAQLNFYYYFGEEDGSWRPYFVGGVSYFDQDDTFSDGDLVSDEEETHQVQMGLGLAKMLTERWEFRGDVRLYHSIREGQDGTNDPAINLAFNYYFGGAAPAAVAEAPPRTPEPLRIAEPARRTITIRLNVEFEFDKDVVLAVYGDELQAVASAMKEHDDILLVLEGHTDSRGSDEYNQDLSQRRAAAVKKKLVSDYGIPGGRISTVGYGESRPVDTNETDEGRQRNRRVVGEMSVTEIVLD
ncbi:MAG: OmpA family protein [bacterium]